jgi:hypothetical protein
MRIADHLLAAVDRLSPPSVVHAHCDLPCGVYDPAQARIEAESIKGVVVKFNDSDDADFKTRAILIKEERAESCGPTTSSRSTSRSTPSCTTCSGRPPRRPATRRSPPTSPWPTTCWLRSTRSPRSSGRPRSSRWAPTPGVRLSGCDCLLSRVS